MPQYGFRGKDRLGNTVEGSVVAEDMTSATRQIEEIGYAPASIELITGAANGETPRPPVPAAAPPPAPARRKPVDLTMPVTEMPEAAADLFAPSGAADPAIQTQQLDSEAPIASSAYVPDARTATMDRFSRLEPWERSVAAAGTEATGAMPQQTVRMDPVPGAGAAAMPEGPGRPGRGPQLVRGLENIPFGANSKREVSLAQRFREVMILPVFSGVVLKDLAPFYRQFATLIGAGLPLYQSLVALEANTNNPRLKEVARNGARQVQAGGRFSDVLAAYPWIFPAMHLEMVRAAEQGGLLDQVFRQIADYVEHEIEIRRLINRETLYPKIVLFVLVMLMGRPGIFEGKPAIVELVAPDAMPGYPGYFADTIGFGLLILVPILVVVVLFRLFWFNIPSVRNGYDSFKIRLPVLGKLIRMFAVAKFARTYAALSRAGFPVGAALQIAGDASGNVVIARASQRAMREADRGVMPSVALGATNQFPSMAMDMLRTGEMSGALDDMMDRVADFQEEEAKLKSHQTALIFSAIVLLLVGLVVLHVLMMFWGGYGAGLRDAAAG